MHNLHKDMDNVSVEAMYFANNYCRFFFTCRMSHIFMSPSCFDRWSMLLSDLFYDNFNRSEMHGSRGEKLNIISVICLLIIYVFFEKNDGN